MIKLKVYNENGDSVLKLIEFETVEQLKEYEAEETLVDNNLEEQVEKLKKDLQPVYQWAVENEKLTPINEFMISAIRKVFNLNK